jgi:hypothetical protein
MLLIGLGLQCRNARYNRCNHGNMLHWERTAVVNRSITVQIEISSNIRDGPEWIAPLPWFIQPFLNHTIWEQHRIMLCPRPNQYY